MGTILAKDIVDDVSRHLLDLGTTRRWSKEELLDYLNQGQRFVVTLRPDLTASNESVQLVAGTKQTLPAGGLRWLDMKRNMGTDGATPGRAIRYIEREELDQINPDWHTATANAVVRHWLFDERDPQTAYVYPPQPAVSPGQVEAVFTKAPTNAEINGVGGSTQDTAIDIDDIYEPTLFNYMVFRALSKETEAQAFIKASGYYELALNTLGLKVQIDRRLDPDKHAPPVQTKPEAS